MRQNEDYINYLKYVVIFAISVIGSFWYSRLPEDEPENLSVFIISIYFMGVFVLYKVGGCIHYYLCCCLPTHSIREQARVYLYTTNHDFMRAYFPDTIGESLDLFVVLLSVGSCLMYVMETYFPFLIKETFWQVLELTISFIFLVDYLMRISLAVDMLQYALSLFGVINVVTVLPVLVYTSDRLFREATNTFPPSVGSGAKMTYLRLLRLAKLLRILRSMNVVKSSTSENVRREITGLVFTVLALIFSAAGVYQWLENDDRCFNEDFKSTLSLDDYSTPGKIAKNGCVYFHEAFYWCSIEVLGRPRLVMKSHLTVLMLVGLVALSVVLIPRHLASVVTALTTTNTYQRQTYRKSGGSSRHLVLVGHKEFASVNMLLYEIFHPDRGEHLIQDVVLLFASFPDRDTLALLAHPSYVGRVTYLQGSPLNEKDLERASIGTAAGVIVLANKDSEMPHWHDGELLACIQSMKAFWLRDTVHEYASMGGHFSSSREARKYVRPRIVTQVLLPETKEYLVELPGWTDRDVVVVCSEYVAWMTAMAAMAKGMATVAFNLMSHTEKQRYYRTKWYPRYEAGATQEIYSRKVKRGGELDQKDVKRASEILARKRVLLIAFERTAIRDEDGFKIDVVSEGTEDFEGVHLFPGPPNFTLRAHDRLFCIAQSNSALQRAFASVGEEVKASESRRTLRVTEETVPRRASFKGVSSATQAVKRIWNSQKSRTWISKMTENDDENDALQAQMQLTRSNSDDDGFIVRENSFTSTRSRVPRGCEDVSRHVVVRPSVSMYSRESSTSGGTAVVELVRKPTVANTLQVDTTRISSTCLTREPKSSEDRKDTKERRIQLYDKLCATEPPWNRHVVICGLPQTQVGRRGGRGLVTELIETLLGSHNLSPWPNEVTRVCIIDSDAVERMVELCMVESRLKDLVYLGRLRAVAADPRKREALMTDASVHSAMTVVALPEHITQAMTKKTSVVEIKDGINRPKMMKQIIDTNTVLTMEVARGCAARVRRYSSPGKAFPAPSSHLKSRRLQCVTLLLQESTTNLFYGHANMRHSGAAVQDPRWMDISPLNMSPLFAAGELLAMTCFDRFAVEALFTPQIAQLTKMFLFGDINGHHLYQIYCPLEFVEASYAKLVEKLRDDGQLAIAMMRSPNEDGSTFIQGEPTEHQGKQDASLPYIITNPDPDAIILQSSDLIFIIGNRCESDLIIRQDSKGLETSEEEEDLSIRVGDEDSRAVGQDALKGQSTEANVDRFCNMREDAHRRIEDEDDLSRKDVVCL